MSASPDSCHLTVVDATSKKVIERKTFNGSPDGGMGKLVKYLDGYTNATNPKSTGTIEFEDGSGEREFFTTYVTKRKAIA